MPMPLHATLAVSAVTILAEHATPVAASPAAILGTGGSLTPGVAAPCLRISHPCARLPYPYLKYVLELPTGLSSAN